MKKLYIWILIGLCIIGIAFGAVAYIYQLQVQFPNGTRNISGNINTRTGEWIGAKADLDSWLTINGYKDFPTYGDPNLKDEPGITNKYKIIQMYKAILIVSIYIEEVDRIHENPSRNKTNMWNISITSDRRWE